MANIQGTETNKNSFADQDYVTVTKDNDTTALDVQIAGDDAVGQSNQIAQSRPADTNAVSVVNPSSSQVITVTKVIIANVTSTDRTFRLFHDVSGTTFDETTALFFDTLVRANESFFVRLDQPIRLSTTDENIAVRSSFASAFNFLFYGQIK